MFHKCSLTIIREHRRPTKYFLFTDLLQVQNQKPQQTVKIKEDAIPLNYNWLIQNGYLGYKEMIKLLLRCWANNQAIW